VTREKLFHSLKNAFISGYISVRQVQAERLGIDLRMKTFSLQNRLWLGRKNERVLVVIVIKWFNADVIARKEQFV
jgi:hypothetical protein